MSSVGLEEALSDAAFRGDVDALSKLLVQDPNILDKHYLKCEDKNVLHVAAMLGNVEFFQAVLRANSSFIQDMCLAEDRFGKNPVHLAASHGKVEILNLINDHDWLVQAAMEKTDRGGTILHLCVKHNQLDALRLLLGILTDRDFQKAKNEDDMTILHLAFYYNQNQGRRSIIILLMERLPTILNLKNANGETAMDLFLREAGIGELLFRRRKKRMCEYDARMTHFLLLGTAQEGRDITNPNESRFEKRTNAMMVVASLIATMAFQAMISPPGGTWQENLLEGDNPHRVGESVMAQTHPKYYKQLMQANTVAFVSSLSIIIVLLSRGIPIRPLHFLNLSTYVMWLSVAAIAVVYSISLVAIVPQSARGLNMSAPGHIAIILIMVWGLVIFGLVLEFVEFVKVSVKPLGNRFRRFLNLF